MLSLILNKDRACLRIAILLSTYLSTSCYGILIESARTSVDEITARPEVTIPQGTVRGVNMMTRHGRNIFGFKGIPFAQPPIGNLRFRAPLPANAWNGILDASGDPNICPQIEKNEFIGDEDCLYLNVYIPRLSTSENSTLLPVVVYVFGGQFKTGHNKPTGYGPQYILDKDVILVVPSYRLGVLGYLSTADEVSPGNYGLKDLVRALEWNRDNIRYFGGDPNQVTLHGSSSGADCVHLLTLSRLTRGLFQRYITNSGSALSPISQQPRSLASSRSTRLGEHLGCPTNTSIALVDCLRSVDASQLVDTESLYKPITNSTNTVWDVFSVIVWGPTVEPDIDGAVLTNVSSNLIAAGKIQDLPRIVSVTRNEGILLSALFYNKPDLFEELLDNFDVVMPYILQYHDTADDVHAMTVAMKSYYLNDLTANRTLLITNFTQLVGDAIFVYPTYNAIQKQHVHTKSPQYFSSFEYRGTFSYSYAYSGGSLEECGVSHTDDLIYLFQNTGDALGPPGSEMNEADREMVDTMVQLWTSFIINGTPTTSDPLTTAIWEPYSLHKNHLRIGNNSDTSIGLEHNFLEKRMQFWDALTAATSWKPF